MTIDEFIAGFTEEPGYLDYGRVGPLSTAAAEESLAFTQVLQRARHGSLDVFLEQDARVRAAASAVTGFPADQIVFQPNTTQGIMHAMFGLTGGVLLSAEEFPSLPIAAVRAQEALHTVQPVWLETDHGKVTPGQIREQLESNVAAVAVSLVDSRTGYLCDIEGIRQVIGDRLLIVDAIQGFGVVDAPVGGRRRRADAAGRSGAAPAGAPASWRCRRGRSSASRPCSRASRGTEEDEPWGEVPPPAPDARAYRVSNPDPHRRGALRGAPRGDRRRRRRRDQRRGRRAGEPGHRARRRVRARRRLLARRAASAPASSCSSRRPSR